MRNISNERNSISNKTYKAMIEWSYRDNIKCFPLGGCDDIEEAKGKAIALSRTIDGEIYSVRLLGGTTAEFKSGEAQIVTDWVFHPIVDRMTRKDCEHLLKDKKTCWLHDECDCFKCTDYRR